MWWCRRVFPASARAARELTRVVPAQSASAYATLRHRSSKSHGQYDVIVVGLGAAGTTAASVLARAGHSTLALEAMDYVGGRVRTVPCASGLVEVGAEWVLGDYGNAVYDVARAAGYDPHPQSLNYELRMSDGVSAAAHGMDAAMRDVIAHCSSVIWGPAETPSTIGDQITQKACKYARAYHPQLPPAALRELLAFLDTLVSNYEATSSWHDSAISPGYQYNGGEKTISFGPLGYRTFFNILLNNSEGVPEPNLNVMLNKEVNEIVWSDPRYASDTRDASDTGPVTVVCADGTQYTAEHVVVTVSLGVLKQRHKTLFSPSLPQDKIEAIETIPFDAAGKICLTFSDIWWPSELNMVGFVWKEEDRKSVAKEDVWTTRISGASRNMGSEKALVLWISGKYCKMMETLPDATVMKKCTELLQRFMGPDYRVPAPTALYRSTWASNPYVLGGYSSHNISLSQHPLDLRAALAAPLPAPAGCEGSAAPPPRVLFAGEATNSTSFSTVHGASDSGRRAANTLLQYKNQINRTRT